MASSGSLLQEYDCSKQLYIQLLQPRTRGLSNKFEWRYIALYIGSWSSIDSTKNNTVNAFSYYKDNIIVVEYQPDEKKVVFRKKDTE